MHHDGRVNGRSARAQDTIQIESEVTGLEFHPIMEHIFVSSDSRGNVCLRDARMAFGPLVDRTGQGVVQVVREIELNALDAIANFIPSTARSFVKSPLIVCVIQKQAA